jgi:hypothetical protein
LFRVWFDVALLSPHGDELLAFRQTVEFLRITAGVRIVLARMRDDS